MRRREYRDKKTKKKIRTLLRNSDNEEVSEFDVVGTFYGKNSNLFRAFKENLYLSNSNFLIFIKTYGKLSEFNIKPRILILQMV